MTGTTHPHVYPPSITLIKENHDGKSHKDFVKLNLCRDPTLPTSGLYEFKMSLFDNGDPEEFLLFVSNFNTTLVASGTLEAGEKYLYLCTIVREESVSQFDSLSANVEGTDTLNVYYISTSLSNYFPLYICCQNKSVKCALE